jgi:hypothetical protein
VELDILKENPTSQREIITPAVYSHRKRKRKRKRKREKYL